MLAGLGGVSSVSLAIPMIWLLSSATSRSGRVLAGPDRYCAVTASNVGTR